MGFIVVLKEVLAGKEVYIRIRVDTDSKVHVKLCFVNKIIR